MRNILWFAVVVALAARLPVRAADWVTYQGQTGPGLGKHIVLVSGDEEYRSEECLPMLGQILAVRHGFKCTVLFSLDPATGVIDPLATTNLVGLKNLESADMMILFTRFRELPDDQMKHFVDFVNSGKPILGIRTATHAFNYTRNKTSPYAKYSFNSRDWPGGFGQQVLGETWVNHHGSHGKESSRGVINPASREHAILRGVTDLWTPSDVYTVSHLPKEAQVLVFGQVLAGMSPTDQPVEGPKNNPMMPIIWTRNYTGESGKTSKTITSTMGCGVDFQNESLRRVIVNACYWALGLEEKIPARANVDYVSDYKPLSFGFGKCQKGVKPADLELKAR